MAEMTLEQLAQRSGCPIERVRRLLRLGVVPERAPGAPFTDADLARVRFAIAFGDSGVSDEELARGIRDGFLSLAFAELALARPTGLLTITNGELLAETGLPPELFDEILAAMGVVGDPGELARDDVAEIARLLALPLAFGISPGTLGRAVRVGGESLRRVADFAGEVWRDDIESPLLERGVSYREMVEITNQGAPALQAVVEQLLLAVYRHHLEAIIFDNMTQRVEEALDSAGVRRRVTRNPAVAFVDLSGYTSLTERLGDRAAAELAGRLAGISQACAATRRGRPVKWLGDGVMFHFPDPSGAVPAVLEMVEQAPAAGLPPAHVGVSAGPVVMRDGDFFGRTVNIASRIADRAGPGEVLVTDAVATGQAEGVRFEPAGEASLKGLSRPVELYRAVRA